jgi:hypothetical protein
MRKKRINWRWVWAKFRRWDEVCWQPYRETPDWRAVQNKIQQLVEFNLSNRIIEEYGHVGSTDEAKETPAGLKIHRIK